MLVSRDCYGRRLLEGDQVYFFDYEENDEVLCRITGFETNPDGRFITNARSKTSPEGRYYTYAWWETNQKPDHEVEVRFEFRFRTASRRSSIVVWASERYQARLERFRQKHFPKFGPMFWGRYPWSFI